MQEVHVASVRMYVAEADIDCVAEHLKHDGEAELVQVDRSSGRLTVVLETDSIRGVTAAMCRLQSLGGVANVNLIFHNVVPLETSQAITA